MSSKNTEVDKAKETSVQLAALYAQDSGTGFEEADSSAYSIPFIQILQSGSPQCKKSDGAYIKGAEEGMLYNTVTQELVDGDVGIVVIPVHYTQRYNEWGPRETGGGFKGEHMSDALPPTTKNERGQDITEEGNILTDTRNHYVLVCGQDGDTTPALMAMSSSQLKKSRQWMSKMQGIKVKDPATGNFVPAPMSSRKYKVTTVAESNDKGSWYGYNIAIDSEVTNPAEYNAAVMFRNSVRKGEVSAKVQEETGTTSEKF
jgi:hypothetical protein